MEKKRKIKLIKEIVENLPFDIVYIGFSYLNGFKYLNVELKDSDLKTIENKSKVISDLLDKIDKNNESYYLNVYSSGSEQEITLDQLKHHLNKNILIETKKTYLKKKSWEGLLIGYDEVTLTLHVNNKGRFQRLVIDKSQCYYIKLTAKLKKEKF